MNVILLHSNRHIYNVLTHYNCICVLVLITVGMVAWVAETWCLLCNKLHSYTQVQLFVLYFKKNVTSDEFTEHGTYFHFRFQILVLVCHLPSPECMLRVPSRSPYINISLCSMWLTIPFDLFFSNLSLDIFPLRFSDVFSVCSHNHFKAKLLLYVVPSLTSKYPTYFSTVHFCGLYGFEK
jgi:hypothetical protein